MAEMSGTQSKPKVSGSRVKVVGVGGGGCNAVSSLMKRPDLHEIEFAVINTDPTDLIDCNVSERLLISSKESSLRGTGGNIDLAKRAVEENQGEVEKVIADVDLLFLVAGFGGGTGTGAAPEIARMATQLKTPTVGVVILPFEYEGPQRVRRAREGVEKMREEVDSLITISNDKLDGAVCEDATFSDAMDVVNDILEHTVKEIGLQFKTAGDLESMDINQIFEGSGFEEGRIVATVYQEK